MYQATTEYFCSLAETKADMVARDPIAFFIAAMLAGAYVGIGIILILTLGGGADASIRPLVMGASFGIALSLVVFAGSELFTGHTMYMSFGVLAKRTSARSLITVWSCAWLGNLVGSGLLALLFLAGGGGYLMAEHGDFLHSTAEYKTNLGAMQLLARGALCNWLVCLALWMAARTQSDTSKLILIFWCLFAFISSGFEHSVANMTLLSLHLFSHFDVAVIPGVMHNLFWVSLGNIIGGAVFISLSYWAISRSERT